MGKLWKYNAKALPEGTVRTWSGQQFKKTGGDWVKVTRGKKTEKKEETQPSYPQDLTKMTPEQQKSSQAFFDKLPDNDLKKRLGIIDRQIIQTRDYLDREYPQGDYKKEGFKTSNPEIFRRMAGMKNLNIMRDQVVKARMKKFKD